MSAAAIGMLAPKPARVRSRTARPPLRLVASHGKLRPDLHVGADQGGVTSPLQGIRLTRRGRLVVSLMATLAMAAVAQFLATSVDASAPQIDHATAVSAGQTLSEVAGVQLPTLPIRDSVARIQLVNGLNTSQVHVGQSLLIPAMP